MSEIASSYFDEGKLRLAERYIFKAFALDHLSPKVLWILGLVKWDYGQIENAIFCFKEIIRIGTRRISKTGYNDTIDIALWDYPIFFVNEKTTGFRFYAIGSLFLMFFIGVNLFPTEL